MMKKEPKRMSSLDVTTKQPYSVTNRKRRLKTMPICIGLMLCFELFEDVTITLIGFVVDSGGDAPH